MGKLKDKVNLGLLNAQSAASRSPDIRGLLIGGLRSELTNLAKEDVKKGKLDTSKPYDLKPNAERLIGAWRRNPLTGSTLKGFKITDEELTQMMKEVLTEVGFKEIKE
jgi:hypothetical protein